MSIRVEVRNPIQYYCRDKNEEIRAVGLFSSQVVELSDVLMKMLDDAWVQVVEFDYERQKYFFLYNDLPAEWKKKISSGAL